MYIPPRRERGEQLTLRVADRDRVLAEYGGESSASLPTQRRFVASPDGSRFAFLRKGKIVVRDARGSEIEISDVASADFRFRSDGSEIVTARRSSDRAEIVVVSATTGGVRPLARVGTVRWLECSREGVVVAENDQMTLATWAGVEHTLAKATGISRVLAGQGSRRAAYVVGDEVTAIDLSNPGGRPTRLWRAAGRITNAEMSPDGSRIALVTDKTVELIENESASRILTRTPGVHTVWFSADGSELAYASLRGLTWRAGKKSHRLDGKNALRGARFHRYDRGLVLARGREALHWKPGSAPVLLADAGRELISAEATRAGIVLFSRDSSRPAV